MSMTDQPQFDQLRGKFQPLLTEIEGRGVQIQMLGLRGRTLFLRAEVPTPDDYDAVWDRIRELDPDLRELEPVITVREGADFRQERPSAHTVRPTGPSDKVRKQGDRGSGFGGA